jgi:uncharacterized RDD family membrane protein YckC
VATRDIEWGLRPAADYEMIAHDPASGWVCPVLVFLPVLSAVMGTQPPNLLWRDNVSFALSWGYKPMTQPPDQGFPQPPPGNAPPPQPFPNMPPPTGDYGYGQQGPAYGQPGMAMAPAGMYIDQQSGLALPQGTALAGLGRRIGAFFLAFPLAVVTLGIGYIIWGLIVWGKGTTPALQVLGCRCWRPEENSVPGWGWMAVRNVIGCFVVERIITLIGLVSFVLMCVNKDRKSLHDMIGGTVVLHDPNKVLDRPAA